MRQLFFLLAYAAVLPTIFFNPFAGMLAYKWLEYMPPSITYLAYALPDKYSFLLAAVTLGCWLAFEKKIKPQPMWLFLLLVAFFVLINLTTLIALVPAEANVKWDRTMKVLAVTIVMSSMIHTRERIEAFLWVTAGCLGYFALIGGLKTLMGGGGGEVVVGPDTTFISDRVGFASYLVICIALLVHLRRHSVLVNDQRLRMIAANGLIFLSAVALLGTYARTALFTAGSMVGMFVLRSRRRFTAIVMAVLGCVAVFLLAPPEWLERMQTVKTYNEDASASGRVEAWSWAFDMALSRPLTGGGFRVFVLNKRPPPEEWLEAHNIFFETMAEHGFPGLAVFVALIVGTYLNCGRIRKLAAKDAELAWAADLGSMLQIGLVAYVAGGQFMSIGTFSILYDLIALSVGLRTLVEARIKATALPLASRRGGSRRRRFATAPSTAPSSAEAA